MENKIKEKILKKAISLNRFGINELAWEKEAAKMLITSLLEENIGILGGDVYKMNLDKLEPMYNNWACNIYNNESKDEYFLRSKIQSLDYINNYPIHPNEKIMFVIVFSEIFE